LARDPRERFQDGAALARALDAGRRSTGRRWLVVAGVSLALVLGSVALAARPRPVAPPPPTAPRPPAAPPRVAPPPPRDPDPPRLEEGDGPTSAAALGERALRKLLSRDPAGAREDATRAIGLEPDLYEAWLVRAHARFDLRDLPGCEEDATRA